LRALVLGASGLIGAHAARAFHAAGWQVRAGARRPKAARALAPAFEWAAAKFEDLIDPAAWAPLLADVDVVVNCVGVLQDGAGDRLEAAHLSGPRALIRACETAKIRRLIHISAVGADPQAGTAYARTKAGTEALLAASDLDWIVLRPSLVLAPGAYGGTAMLRGIASLPLAMPVTGGDKPVRPVWVGDLAQAMVRLAAPGAPSSQIIEAGGPQEVTVAGLVAKFRAWLGLPPAPVFDLPLWLAAPTLTVGDLLGRLGWTSSLRTTSMKQLLYNVAGDSRAWAEAVKITPKSVDQMLADHPATSADRWQARLYFVRPLSILALGVFWIATGLISLGPGWEAALGVLQTGGYGEASVAILVGGGLMDVVLGIALWRRAWTARIAILMALSTVGYLIAGTISLPQLWGDPLGPWLKVVPMMALCLFIAATDDRR